MINIPWGYTWSLHGKISGYYSSKYEFTDEKTFRIWLRQFDFDTQYEEWIRVIKEEWGTSYLLK